MEPQAQGRLVQAFDDAFGAPRGALLGVRAPGRSEIAGNHTDHEGGHVIAGALTCSVQAMAAANGTDAIRVMSEGYAPFEVRLDDLSPREDEKVTTAGIVRGMAAELAAAGRTPSGFDLVATSNIPGGGGLSSSAAFEALMGRVMETLWKGPEVPAVELAKMCQRTENRYFGKPCGLMDQLSVCLGGIAHMDLSDAETPRAERLDFDFAEHGYALCLVDVGCDHSRYTDEYAAVPAEMHAVAAEFGAERLCEVDPSDFDERVGDLRARLGDRAVLRALHYWLEDDLVEGRWDALRAQDMDRFLELTRRSGANSGMYLQNVACGTWDQPAMVALALAERLLAGRGAVRIHGGGFGGSIQAFVPLDAMGSFSRGMDAWLGKGSCRSYDISLEGAEAAWL